MSLLASQVSGYDVGNPDTFLTALLVTNSVGRLSSAEIDHLIKEAESFKQADKEFSAKHEAKQSLETYVQSVENTIAGPDAGKIKRAQKGAVEQELAKALERLEIEDSTADELRKAQLGLKCVTSLFFAAEWDQGILTSGLVILGERCRRPLPPHDKWTKGSTVSYTFPSFVHPCMHDLLITRPPPLSRCCHPHPHLRPPLLHTENYLSRET